MSPKAFHFVTHANTLANGRSKPFFFKRATTVIVDWSVGRKCKSHNTLYINQSINPLAWTECGDSLPFSGGSSIPPYHTLFPVTPLRQPFFHPPSLHPAIYFLVCLLVLLFPNSCTILFWEYNNIYSDQYQKFSDMFQFKGTTIRTNMTTQCWYI